MLLRVLRVLFEEGVLVAAAEPTGATPIFPPFLVGEGVLVDAVATVTTATRKATMIFIIVLLTRFCKSVYFVAPGIAALLLGGVRVYLHHVLEVYVHNFKRYVNSLVLGFGHVELPLILHHNAGSQMNLCPSFLSSESTWQGI